MKKLVIAILAILYMGVSSGIAMEIHYCMGKKAGFDFYGDQSDKCGKCGMTGEKKGCCNDEYKFIKLQDDHKNVPNQALATATAEAMLIDYVVIKPAFFADSHAAKLSNHSPPDPARPATFILNCVFRL